MKTLGKGTYVAVVRGGIASGGLTEVLVDASQGKWITARNFLPARERGAEDLVMSMPFTLTKPTPSAWSCRTTHRPQGQAPSGS